MNISVPHSTPKCGLSATKQAVRKSGASKKISSAAQFAQLSLWESPQSQREKAPYIQITSVPERERINPKEHRYQLIIQPQCVRACGAQITAQEAHEIAEATRGWDWSLGDDGRLRCLPRLEALLDGICQRSFQGKGGGQ